MYLLIAFVTGINIKFKLHIIYKVCMKIKIVEGCLLKKFRVNMLLYALWTYSLGCFYIWIFGPLTVSLSVLLTYKFAILHCIKLFERNF